MTSIHVIFKLGGISMILKLIKAICEFFNKKNESEQVNRNMIAWSLETSAISRFDIRKLYDEIDIQ